jgi:membrane-associated phospholipid phosphatase
MKAIAAIFSVSLLLSPYSSLSQSRFTLASSPDSWLVPVTIGISAGGYLLHTDPSTLTKDDLARLDRNSVPAFDRPATHLWSKDIKFASDITLGVVAAAPLFILTEFSGDYKDLFGMYAMTMALAVSVPQYTKSLGRVRPLAYNEDAPLEERIRWDITRSFFSGHATISTAAGVFVATVYETYRPGSSTARALWIGCVGMGFAVGTMRIVSGMHFPSDVAVGLIVGAAIGYAVPHLHKRDLSGLITPQSAPPPIVVYRIPL